MPGAVSGGEPVPPDGALPAEALAGAGTRPFGFYVHVPFCATRCGYCDFNTYTAAELDISRAGGLRAGGSGAGGSGAGGSGAGPGIGPGIGAVSPASYPALAIAEVSFARKVLGDVPVGVSTVFFGGGTPSLLTPAAIGGILAAIDAEFGLVPGAEVTIEANPESVTEATLNELRDRGVTRASFGMQSAVPEVLAVLDRVHQPGRSLSCVAWAKAAGFEHVSLDLIYGTPGESDADWRRSVAAAIGAGPDHLSGYALTVEPGTRLAARVRRGELAAPDDDVLAGRYVIADDMLTEAGYGWYEISNWAVGEQAHCAHNLLYWTGGDWWGIGPGAHSHVGGTRWWNVRHPAAYGARIAAGLSPAQAREILNYAERQLETVMLSVRLSAGCPVGVLDEAGRAAVPGVIADGLAEVADGRLILTRRGRLLADTVVRALT
jgi:putative oxygen-independent coproporphyrinogen III oxidase